MARPRKEVPNLFVHRGRWVFKIGDTRRTLCPLTPEQQAVLDKGRKPQPTAEQHQELLSVLLEVEPTRRTEDMRVDDLCNLYLRNRDGQISQTKFNFYRRTLSLFCERHGANSLMEITPDMVQTFVRGQESWVKSSSKRNAYKVVLQAFNFAVTNRYLIQSPIAAVGKAMATETPDERREVYLTPAQEAAIAARMNRASLALFKALMATGRRPDEIANAKKDEVHETPHGLIWKIKKHKNWKLTRKPATIDHLTPAMQQLTRELLADPKNKTPYLFATIQGKKWTGANAIKMFENAVERAAKDHPELGIDPDLTPYVCRHTMITRCLLKGIPLPVVAHWVGNSAVTLQKHYNQITRVSVAETAAHVALLSAT